MVSDDFRAMATSQSALTSVNIAITTTPFVTQDNNRVALIIGAPSTNRVTLNFEGAAVLDNGVTLYPGQAPLVLSLAQHGAIVKKPVAAIAAAGAQQMNAITVTATLQ